MRSEGKTMLSAFGLDALVLFKKKKMAIFFLFPCFFGLKNYDFGVIFTPARGKAFSGTEKVL